MKFIIRRQTFSTLYELFDADKTSTFFFFSTEFFTSFSSNICWHNRTLSPNDLIQDPNKKQ